MNWIDEIDDILARVEDTAKGEEGDMITKVRGIINENYYKAESEEEEDLLISAYEKYIQLLQKELDEVVPIASNHGWESSLVEEGLVARNRINKLKKEQNVLNNK